MGRRASDAGIETAVGCHTFRATGIMHSLTSGERVEVAQRMAGPSNAEITGPYDRRNDGVSARGRGPGFEGEAEVESGGDSKHCKRELTMSHLLEAAREGDFETVKTLLKEKPDLALSKDSYDGSAPLHAAAFKQGLGGVAACQ